LLPVVRGASAVHRPAAPCHAPAGRWPGASARQSTDWHRAPGNAAMSLHGRGHPHCRTRRPDSPSSRRLDTWHARQS
jgi:hypothetical protein